MPSAFEHPHRIDAILDVLGLQGLDKRSRDAVDLAAALLNDNMLAEEDYLNGLDVARNVSPITSGFVTLWAGSTAAIPQGWLRCNGAAISRSNFSLLFTVIGVTYGVGDGSTTFNVPTIAAVGTSVNYIIKT